MLDSEQVLLGAGSTDRALPSESLLGADGKQKHFSKQLAALQQRRVAFEAAGLTPAEVASCSSRRHAQCQQSQLNALRASARAGVSGYRPHLRAAATSALTAASAAVAQFQRRAAAEAAAQLAEFEATDAATPAAAAAGGVDGGANSDGGLSLTAEGTEYSAAAVAKRVLLAEPDEVYDRRGEDFRSELLERYVIGGPCQAMAGLASCIHTLRHNFAAREREVREAQRQVTAAATAAAAAQPAARGGAAAALAAAERQLAAAGKAMVEAGQQSVVAVDLLSKWIVAFKPLSIAAKLQATTLAAPAPPAQAVEMETAAAAAAAAGATGVVAEIETVVVASGAPQSAADADAAAADADGTNSGTGTGGTGSGGSGSTPACEPLVLRALAVVSAMLALYLGGGSASAQSDPDRQELQMLQAMAVAAGLWHLADREAAAGVRHRVGFVFVIML